MVIVGTTQAQTKVRIQYQSAIFLTRKHMIAVVK